MPRERLPLSALPAWRDFNSVTFTHVKIQHIPEKGHGLITQAAAEEIGQLPLVTVPHDLVLNAEAVDEFSKEDKNFRALLDVCANRVSRVYLTFTDIVTR